MPRKKSEKKSQPETETQEQHDEMVEEELESIYEDADGQSEDVSQLVPVRKRGIFRFLFSTLLLLIGIGAVAWLGYWVFMQFAPAEIREALTDTGGVSITIEAPDQVQAGEVVEYVITYENKKRVAINNISLNVLYPSGLRFADAAPLPLALMTDEADGAAADTTPRREDDWSLGSLAAGQSGTVTITGTLVGEAGSNQNLWAVLAYEPENFSSQFQTEASAKVVIAESPIAVTITGSDQVGTDETAELTISYENASQQTVPAAFIELGAPDSFDVSDAQPQLDDRQRWQLGDVAPGDTGELYVKGTFAANASGSQEFVIRLYTAEDDGDVLLSETPHEVILVSGDLLVELKLNGSADNQTAAFGDVLQYSLTYQNAGSQAFEDLTASVFFSATADVVEWTTLNDRYDGTPDEFEAGRLVTWTGEEVPNLARLEPGEKGVIDFSVRLSRSAEGLSGEVAVRNVASIRIGAIAEEAVQIESRSNSLLVELNSDLSLDAFARYFADDGSSLGSGPIPPKVDETTYYVVQWQLDNSVHEVNNVVVSATLPEGVQWAGVTDIAVGSMEYELNSRRVTWVINRMPLDLSLDYIAQFEVSITPAGKDVGKVLALTGDHAVKATDAATKATIEFTKGSLTTDLTRDPLAQDKGLVQE